MKIEDIWEKLFSYWNTLEEDYKPSCIGATEEEIVAFEKNQKFNLIFPKELRESLKICNKKIYSKEHIKNGDEWEKYNTSKFYSMFHKVPKRVPSYVPPIFSIKDMIGRRYIDDESPEEWIPLYSWDSVFWAVLDMRKDAGEKVLFINNENYEAEEIVWANSYEEWLKMIINEVIEHNKIRSEWLYQIRNSKQL